MIRESRFGAMNCGYLDAQERKRGNAPHSKRCREIRADLEELSRWFMGSGFSRLRMYWGHEPDRMALMPVVFVQRDR